MISQFTSDKISDAGGNAAVKQENQYIRAQHDDDFTYYMSAHVPALNQTFVYNLHADDIQMNEYERAAWFASDPEDSQGARAMSDFIEDQIRPKFEAELNAYLAPIGLSSADAQIRPFNISFNCINGRTDPDGFLQAKGKGERVVNPTGLPHATTWDEENEIYVRAPLTREQTKVQRKAAKEVSQAVPVTPLAVNGNEDALNDNTPDTIVELGDEQLA